MRVTCNRNTLLEAYQIVNSVIPLRSTIPVLQNIKINTTAKTICLTGTDLEIGIRTEIPAEVKETGQLVLPTQHLGAILRETVAEEVNIESEDHIARITTKGSQYRIMGTDPVDYPDFPSFDLTKAIEIDPKGVKEMIQKTSFAVSGEIARYALTGLLVEIRKKELRMVGSDGKRLAYIRKKSEQTIPQEVKVVVPVKGMEVLARIIKDDDTKIKMIIDETQLKVNLKPSKNGSETQLFSRLVEGVYPDYEAVIPSDCDKKIEIDPQELYSAFRRVSVVTTDKFRATKLSFKDNKLTLLSRTQEIGEAKVDLDIKYDANPFEIVFNPDFFIDILRILEREEKIILELKDKISPAVFRIGRDYIYLVMPLTVDI